MRSRFEFLSAFAGVIACSIASFAADPILAETPADQTPSDHAKSQVGRLHQIKQLADGGQIAEATARIAAVKREVQALPATNPTRMDGEEMAVALLAAQGNFSQARPLSEEVVKARRIGPATERLLLCWSLLQHAIILDGAGDAAASDRVMEESVLAARDAFPSSDNRRAQMLEAFADLMALGYNRPLAGINLYEAAIAAREANPEGSAEELAETLRKLAQIEPAQGLDVAADSHVAHAIAILEHERAAAQEASKQSDLESDLVTLYGLRVGIVARAQRYDDARALLVPGRAHSKNTPAAPYIEIYAAEIDRREAEGKGDFAAALVSIRRGIKEAQGLKDEGLVAALQLVEGRIQIETSDFAGAELTVDGALKVFAASPRPEGARTAEGWLLLARIERSQGHEERASRWVTGALAMLKSRRSEVAVLFATNRAPHQNQPQPFGTGIAPALTFGEALVLVPGAPPIAGAGLSTLGGPTALERLFVTNVKALDIKMFAEAARARSATSKLYQKSALVFVHGFGTSFEFALARAAQISRDIAYDGPTFSFVWPSQGKTDPFAYGADETAAGASADQFVEFLTTIAGVTGADKIHIIAHSMGNQILLNALGKIEAGLPAPSTPLASKIGEIVFASPDVGQFEFQTKTAALKGRRMTLYASAYDKALWISFVRNASIRAGSVLSGLMSPGKPVITPGVDSIDVSEAGRDYFNFNHDTYASNPYVANDLRRLLQSGERPPTRRSAGIFEEHGLPPAQYWTFRKKLAR